MIMLRLKNYFMGLLVLISAQTGFADMISSITINGHVGAEVAFFPANYSQSPSGNLTLGNIPKGATIVNATLYGHNWARSQKTSATFAGTPLGSTSAFASDRSFGQLEAYKWDVTPLVTGNGTYTSSASGFNNNYGLALLVIFSDASLPLQRVVVNDGAIDLDAYYGHPATKSTTFSGFGSGPGNLWIYTEADDSGFTNEQILFNGNVVGGPIDGDYASLFNIPVNTQFGINTAQIYSPADEFGWHLAVLTGPVPEPATILLFGLGAAIIRKFRN